MQDLRTKTAVVTGAAGGIGLAVAARMATEGMSVVMADVDADDLHTAAKNLAQQGLSVLAIEADVADPAAMTSLADAAMETFGQVDVVCANAGVAGPWSDAEWAIPLAEWQRVFSINVFGIVNTLAAFVPRMLERGEAGHIVVTTSLASFLTTPLAAPYFASKHAALSVTETLRAQLKAAEAPISVSVLCPDRVRTRVIERELIHTHGPSGAAAAADVFAGSGVLEPDEVAALVLDGIRQERYLLLTHGESREHITARLRELNDEVARA